MTLKADFQDTLQFFIFSNLPLLMNASNATNVLVADQVLPAVAVTANISAPPVIIISPEIAQALQAYVLNNFPDIGLPADIQQVSVDFFANLPPLIPIAPGLAAASTLVPVSATSDI